MSLSIGDRLPVFVGVDTARHVHSSDAQAGRPALLLLAGTAPPGALAEALAARRTDFATNGTDIAVLLAFSAVLRLHRDGPAGAAGLPAFLCPDDYFAALAPPLAVLIDRAGRIAGLWSAAGDPALTAAAAVDAAVRLAGPRSARPRPAGRNPRPAPVLFIPGLLDPALCRALVEGFDAAGHFDSLVSGAGAAEDPADRVDHSRKCRRDWLLQSDDRLFEPVIDRLRRTCIPEMARAFQHRVAHIDRLLVARYDEGIGFFRRHRDNNNRAVAFREFALSVNLNDGDYEGGHLTFPEYDDRPYAPRTGEALVFSASLLHEAARVRRGCRYVLLTFLHGDEAERRRLAALSSAAPQSFSTEAL